MNNEYISRLLQRILELLNMDCFDTEEEHARTEEVKKLVNELVSLLSNVQWEVEPEIRHIEGVIKAFIKGYVHIHTLETIAKFLLDVMHKQS